MSTAYLLQNEIAFVPSVGGLMRVQVGFPDPAGGNELVVRNVVMPQPAGAWDESDVLAAVQAAHPEYVVEWRTPATLPPMAEGDD